MEQAREEGGIGIKIDRVVSPALHDPDPEKT